MKQTSALIFLTAILSVAGFPQTAPSNTIAALGYLNPAPVPVAPGQLITLFVTGLASGDITVTVKEGSSYPAPVLSATSTSVTVQIPYEVQPPCPGLVMVCNDLAILTQIFVSANGTTGAPFQVTPVADHVHLLTSCDTVLPNGGGVAPLNGLPCSPLITHGDGSLVNASSPAQGNEELVAYAVGLGATNPAVPTGKAASSGAVTTEGFELAFNWLPNALAAKPIPLPLGALPTRYGVPVFSGLVPGYVGLYQINFVVPPPPTGADACGEAVISNVTMSVGGAFSFDGAGFCVALPQ